ncbi:MAG: hypothetical protein HYZ94_02845, partial [Candidatus Omnitrophica bacterium]|nr:hypothetical protein [Candidatus Omnitrophota bacterium]
LLDAGVFVHNSVDGDAAAALRYTEARLAHIAEELLEDIDKETVDFMPNFDGSLTEPRVLPSRLPNLLVNGSSGIAVGMATNIPPHNLGEIVDALVALIDEPEADLKDLMKAVEGPDFPTGGIICGRDGIVDAYATGRGALRVRAKAHVEELKGGKEAIIVSELPYQINKATLIEHIAKLVQDKQVEGVADLRDESDKDGMRVVIETKRDANAQVILNQLYKHTQLEATFGVIMLALVDGRPRVLSLKQLLLQFLEHRKEIVLRRTKFELARAQERAHILEGLKKALDHLDAVIKAIRQSKSPADAKAALMKRWDFTDRQAQAILEMQLQRLTHLEREKIDQEYLELIKRIALYEAILKSEQKVLEVIKEECLALKKRYGDGRRTQIVEEVQEMKIEDLIAEEDVVIAISHAGYIKRLPVSAYRRQRRGGVGVTAMETREEDFVEHLFIASTHEYLLFFTNQGRAYWLKVHEVPQAGRYHQAHPAGRLRQPPQGRHHRRHAREGRRGDAGPRHRRPAGAAAADPAGQGDPVSGGAGPRGRPLRPRRAGHAAGQRRRGNRLRDGSRGRRLDHRHLAGVRQADDDGRVPASEPRRQRHHQHQGHEEERRGRRRAHGDRGGRHHARHPG